MTMGTNDVSPRAAAILAGLGLLLMAIVAPLANFYGLENLTVAGNASATFERISANQGLLRWSVVGFLVVAALDVLVAWALYVLLEPVSKNLALLMAWFRLVYGAVLALSLNPLLGVVQMLESGLEAVQLRTQVMRSLEGFRSGWDIGLVLFGFHLLVLGFIAVRTVFIPRWLGALLLVAGLGYVVDSLGRFLIAKNGFSLSVYTFVGEFLLIFWLFWKALLARPEARLRGVQA